MDVKKHAYLIMAHNEFEVLQRLVLALDDERNDIYIHIDAKAKSFPRLKTSVAGLFILERRRDVRWGHSSQVDVMLDLLEQAFGKFSYDRFHLISGVHMPLQSQDEMHAFFGSMSDQNYLMNMPANADEADFRLRRYHFFVRNFMHRNPVYKTLYQFCWHLLLKLQKLIGMVRNKNYCFFKASQWASLTNNAVYHLLSCKDSIRKRYRHTFCSDEFFVASTLKEGGFDSKMVFTEKLLKCEFSNGSPRLYMQDDFSEIMNSGCLFARKFGNADLDVVDRILKNIGCSFYVTTNAE